ncbi:unnamed protein product [Brassicogethes aeneus]|uniref:RGS domain-containing protein n=1 Tax=Brassicogethes aeneus TaxID=1431903 RepID=A0A9P0B3R5_BRAAE|nr:unnamed protein product [Brassicogethes aeneus]
MISFWKKSVSGQNRTNAGPVNEVSSRREPLNVNPAQVKDIKGPLANFDDEGLFDIDDFESKREKTRLSKTLQEILSDKGALNYFIQYLESRNASQYIMCYLDIETFKSDIKAQPDFLHSKIEHDSLSVSTDCDSLTADTSSLNDFPSERTSHDVICDNSDSLRLKSELEEFTHSALNLFKKYVAQEAVCNIRISEEIRREVMESICATEKVLSGECFEGVQQFVYGVLEVEYFGAFLGTDYYCKHQIDVLTGGGVVLEDILYNETALFYFMEFLEQENTRALLEFWIAASNFQQQLHDQKDFFDPIEAQNDAVVLYDKYFSLQAHCPLGFSDKVRFAVEQNICGEDGLILDCFHLPLKIIEKVLDEHHLKSFLASQLFYKYLSELINTVQSNGYSTSIDSKYSPSDCSSEKSFCTNTFLALEMQPHCARRKENRDMSIDTRELYDPDSLWKRKKTHRLSLGHMTNLGKYETEFEPEPDRKGFKLSTVVKKFVSLEEETKKKEDMAWQVAEMIIKDITNVTLNDKV